jgi:hypothetical protein
MLQALVLLANPQKPVAKHVAPGCLQSVLLVQDLRQRLGTAGGPTSAGRHVVSVKNAPQVVPLSASVHGYAVVFVLQPVSLKSLQIGA